MMQTEEEQLSVAGDIHPDCDDGQRCFNMEAILWTPEVIGSKLAETAPGRRR